MPTSTRKKLPFAPRRRVADDEDEEDQVPLDSFSDDSGLSEYEEEEEEDEVVTDYSDEEGEGNEEVEEPTPKVVNGTESKSPASVRGVSKKAAAGVEKNTREHDIMVNGVPEDEKNGEEVDFEDMGSEVVETEEATQTRTEPQPKTTVPTKETPFERRKREHEIYKKRRDADPAFVPNRGAFFMHDHRAGGNNFRPFAGRGRGGAQSRFQQNREPPQPTPPTDNKWKHDMHEETLNSEKQQNNNFTFNQQNKGGRYAYPKPNGTQIRGTVQIIVKLPGMENPITFSEVPCKTHQRLPPHRPPLRRDKPVRIALPEHPIRYIYPTQHRSFVFIPRNMRPGFAPPFQNKFAGKPFSPHNSFNNHGKIGTPPSGSTHQSRRSSFSKPKMQVGEEVGDITQQGETTQPVPDYSMGEYQYDVGDLVDGDSKPVVKLPTVTPQMTAAPATAPSSEADETARTPSVKVPPANPYPTPPAQPLQEVRGTPTIPMHHPRPQKAVSISDVENPAIPYAYVPPPPPPPPMPVYQTHSRNASYQSNEAPNLEAAVHAPPFQPGYGMPPYFYSAQYMPAFIPSMGMDPNMMQPMFVPPPPPPYMPGPVPVSTSQAAAGASGVVAQESNGTVYFYDQSQYNAMSGYQYGMMPVTPGPDGTAQGNGDGNQNGTAPAADPEASNSAMNPAAVSYYYPTQGVYYG